VVDGPAVLGREVAVVLGAHATLFLVDADFADDSGSGRQVCGACPVSGAGRAGRSGEAPGALAFHSFSTVPGLLGPAGAGTLTWLRLGAQLLNAVHGSCPRR
jgi:hypothetical protein